MRILLTSRDFAGTVLLIAFAGQEIWFSDIFPIQEMMTILTFLILMTSSMC